MHAYVHGSVCICGKCMCFISQRARRMDVDVVDRMQRTSESVKVALQRRLSVPLRASSDNRNNRQFGPKQSWDVVTLALRHISALTLPVVFVKICVHSEMPALWRLMVPPLTANWASQPKSAKSKRG